jgi:DNA-binding LacI/PurR family transcriptional regulator
MKDVARKAGVSIATVSNVINRPGLVADRTTVKVRSVIEELGFVPNNSARQLRAGTSPMISVIVPDIANPFFAELVRGVEARAVEHDLAVFVSSTEGDVDREHRYLNVVIGQRPRGLLFTPAGDLDRPLSVLGNRHLRCVPPVRRSTCGKRRLSSRDAASPDAGARSTHGRLCARTRESRSCPSLAGDARRLQ